MKTLNELYLENVRKQLEKEMDIYERGENLILEFRHELNQFEELLDRAKAIEFYSKMSELADLIAKVSSDIYEMDEDQKKGVKRINTYREILGLAPIKVA